MTDLRDLYDDDGLSRYNTSSCLETCHTTPDMLGETLNLDDVVRRMKITQIGGSRATDEAGQSTHRRKKYK